MNPAPAIAAVTGAPLTVSVDGAPAPMWARIAIPAGATLRCGSMTSGCRSYLAVAGGFDAPPLLGSRSTDLNSRLGPLDGHALQTGDRLPVRTCVPASPQAQPRVHWTLDARPWFAAALPAVLRLIPCPHLDVLTETSCKLLFESTFVLGNDSDRTGLRLTGPRLEWSHPTEIISAGCVPGLLQLPPSGQPIAFGPECPVSGGYPRLGQIAAVDFPKLAQLRPDSALRFAPCTLDAALSAWQAREQALQHLENAIRARLAPGHPAKSITPATRK